jgi:Rps23 Pro-64 3,4-dihydroxylase Tpa1-like proline 4-hydroxylase
MSVLQIQTCGNYLHFQEEQCIEAGRARADEYQSAEPFPHIVMRDFIDSEILREVNRDFPARTGQRGFDRDQEKLKFQFKPDLAKSQLVRNLLAELNTTAFVAFLENMTGITGLIPDPHFDGAGLHETLRGGHLGIHADFRVHARLNLERRLNLLIYLNEDWSPDFGGALEIWDRKMRAPARLVLPTLGTAVVFNTDPSSFHGHPDPLACPPDRSRRSIATYYYTALDQSKFTPRHSTAFQTRPRTTDRADIALKVDHFIADWMPPRLQRSARRLSRKFIGNSTIWRRQAPPQ